MSTNSTIGIKRLNGSEKRIYCHYDGYVEHNGVLLQLCYDTPEKIEKLLELGNLSSLGECLLADKKHTDVCVAYHRDHGESLEDATNYGEQEFNYTFDENIGAWIVEQYSYDCIGSKYIYSKFEYKCKSTNFLIDEIMRCKESIVKYWVDDEFAIKENLIDTLLNKAKEQAKIANERQAEEYDAWYRAYCD